MASSCPPFEFSAKYYHADGGSCVRQSSFFEGKAVLNQGVGYSVILGFGAFFAVFTSFLVLKLFVFFSWNSRTTFAYVVFLSRYG